MEFTTLIVERSPRMVTVTLHRPEARNSLNQKLLEELNLVLDQAERDPECVLITLQGQEGVFCTGMDFTDVLEADFTSDRARARLWAAAYMKTLRRLTLIAKVVVAKVDGLVLAGGVGIVAACDQVIATERAQFCLSEALFGLLPANVLPHLIRKVGFAVAYGMALTTRSLAAAEAREVRLVDELTNQPDDAVRKLMVRVCRLDSRTLAELKAYFRKLWIVTEEMEQLAVDELARLITESRIQRNIANFVQHQKFPWEK